MLDRLIAAVKDAIISIDEAQNVVLFNPAAEAIFRCPAEEALGRPLDRFIPVSAREGHRKLVEQYGAHGDATHAMDGGARLLTGLRADGEVFPIEASISKIDALGGKLFTEQLINATMRSVRRIATDLRSVMLDNLGLVPTLEWLVQDFARRSGGAA